MNKRKTTDSMQGVKFDDRTLSSGSLSIVKKEVTNYLMGKTANVSNFVRTHSSVLKYAAGVGTMCLITNEVYAVDIVTLFSEKISTPIHTLVKDNYGKGVAVIAAGYMVMTEGADLRTKAIRAGVGAFLGYGLGDLLF